MSYQQPDQHHYPQRQQSHQFQYQPPNNMAVPGSFNSTASSAPLRSTNSSGLLQQQLDQQGNATNTTLRSQPPMGSQQFSGVSAATSYAGGPTMHHPNNNINTNLLHPSSADQGGTGSRRGSSQLNNDFRVGSSISTDFNSSTNQQHHHQDPHHSHHQHQDQYQFHTSSAPAASGPADASSAGSGMAMPRRNSSSNSDAFTSGGSALVVPPPTPSHAATSTSTTSSLNTTSFPVIKLDSPSDVAEITGEQFQQIQELFLKQDASGFADLMREIHYNYEMKKNAVAPLPKTATTTTTRGQRDMAPRQTAPPPPPSSQQQQQQQIQPSQRRAPSNPVGVRKGSTSTSTRDTRPPPSGKAHFDILTFNVLNEEHYATHCHATHKMSPKDRFARQQLLFKNIIETHKNLGFLCLQEVSILDMYPVFHFLRTKNFDFVFSINDKYESKNGGTISLEALEDRIMASREEAKKIPNDVMVIVFNSTRFKVIGNPIIKPFLPFAPPASSRSQQIHVNPAKVVMSQLFEDTVTNHVFKVVNAHMPFEQDDANKLNRLHQLLEDFNAPGNFILCGDFNIDERKDTNVIRNTFTHARYGTWNEVTENIRATSISPSGMQTQKVDYIFVKGDGIRLDLDGGKRSERESCFVDPDNENLLLKHQGTDPLYTGMFCSDHSIVLAKLEIG